MAVFPPNTKFDWQDLALTPESIVQRSEMERGIPKQQRTQSDARVEVQMTVHHDTKAEAAAFEDWFFDDLMGGQGWFDWTHPVTGTVVQARVVDGQLGPLKFAQPTLQASSRSFKIEYWRPTW
ncbi:MAG: hypothetical protein E6Q67_04950 [Roseateles sp.]|nr:MAG: hypothetical protein E6Q67_04950 [Roseateles sp.]